MTAAVIGLGMVAETHVRAIADIPGSALAGLCARDLCQAEAYAARSAPINGDMPAVLASVDQVAADESIDFERLYTPPNARLEIAVPWWCDPALQAQIDSVTQAAPDVPIGFAGCFAPVADDLAEVPAPTVTAAGGRRSIELVAAIYQTARTATVVSLPLTSDHPLYHGWHPTSEAFL